MTNEGTVPNVVSPESTPGGASVGEGGGISDTPLPSPLETAGYIVESYSVEKELFEQVSGLPLNEKILEVRPQGSRLIVLLNPPPEEFGGIILPEQWQQTEKAGSGWVVSVGPAVGSQCAHPGGPNCAPWQLLYKQIIFGSYAGKVIRVDFYDRETKSPFVILTDRDIWAVDLTPSEHLAEK